MSLPRYPKYKDSGVEWLGEVPEHWLVDRLKRRCLVFPSNVDKKSYEGELAVRLCNYTDVYYRDEILSDIDFMLASATTEQVARFTLRAGDTIITKDSETADDIAIAAYVPNDLPGVVCGYHLAMVRPIHDANGRFVKCLFDAHYAKSCFAVRANGLTRKGLGQHEIQNVDLPWPPLPEQAAIAAFLDHETAKIDALIAEQEKLIELLKEKRQAVISHAVTKGLNPDRPMKDSGIEWLGEVPAHWEVRKLGQMCTKIGDGMHGTPEYVDRSPFRFINGNNLAAGWVQFSETTRCVSEAELGKHRVPLDDTTVLMSINGTIGNLALYRGESVMLGKSAAFLNCSRGLNREFLSYFLQCSFVRTYFDCSATGTTVFNLSLEAIRSLPTGVPPLHEQAEIVVRLHEHSQSFDLLLAAATRSSELLQERRSALISAAVTGQIDVRNFTGRAA